MSEERLKAELARVKDLLHRVYEARGFIDAALWVDISREWSGEADVVKPTWTRYSITLSVDYDTSGHENPANKEVFKLMAYKSMEHWFKTHTAKDLFVEERQEILREMGALKGRVKEMAGGEEEK